MEANFYIEYENSSGSQYQEFTTGNELMQFISDNASTFINHCKVVAKLPEITDMYGMFSNCSNLTSIDLSDFNTSGVTNMFRMFYNCSNLTTIYCNDDWSNGIVSHYDYMFSGCTSLVGAISYDSDKTNIDYANPTTGYFTVKRTAGIGIYFDNVLIDEDSYTALSNDYQLFTDSFKLGSVASNSFKLSVNKSMVSTQPTNVRIEDDNTTFYLVVDSVAEDKYTYTYTLTDKLVEFNFNYDAKPLIDSKKENGENTYLSDILEDMCIKANVELDENFVLTNNIIVDWYDNTIQARKYLSFIGQLQGGYACILPNGKLTFKRYKKASSKTIDVDECSELIIKEKKKITRVVYDTGVVKWEFGDETGNTVYIDPDNVFITNEGIVESIYNNIVDFEFYTLEVPNAPMDSNIRAGDIITFIDGDNEYPTIAGYSMSYGGGWTGGYTCLLETKKQEETQIVGTNSKLLSIKTIVDRTNASVQTIAERVDDTETSISSITQDIEGIDLEVAKITPLQTKTAQLELDVNKLRSEIGDVTDITTQEEGAGTLLFESINTSEPINITIRPSANKDISYLYPSSRLFPSSSLFPQDRILRFYNSTEDETIDYLLPGNLRYLSPTVYDEFFLDYSSLTCKIIRKVAIDGNMVKTALAEPIEETFTYPDIPLSAGDYTVTMLGYPNAYMKVRLMSQNMYTSQFATRVELSSAITQTANEINLEVVKKTDKTAIISTINQTAEAIKINASKINISGVITAMNNDTTTTINGNKITTGSITASQVSSEIITTTNFSAQNINANKITSGTLNASNVTITNLSASNIKSGRLNITSGNYYLRMGFTEGANPSVSGLNVGNYGIKAYSGITAQRFAITDGDTGKTFSIQVPRQGGGYYYMTWTEGILTSAERN